MAVREEQEREGAWSLAPCAIPIGDPDYEFDNRATQKMPATPVRGPSLLKVAASSMLVSGTLAAALLAAFGSQLAPPAFAARPALRQVEAAIPTPPAPPAAPAPATEEPQVGDEPAVDKASACETALEDLGPQRRPLCTWLAARAERRPAGAAPTLALRMLLAREGTRKIAGRVVRDGLEPGVYQITSSGVWGYCLRAASCPSAGADGVFWMWVRRTDERASVQVQSGRVESCVLLEEAPVGAASDLASMPDGPDAADLASRVLAALNPRQRSSAGVR